MHIPTVSGPLAPERLGVVLMHEHLDSLALPGFQPPGGTGELAASVAAAVAPLAELGVGTIVDLAGRTRVLAGHALELLEAVAPRLPLHVVTGFSWYKDPWLEGAGYDDLRRLTGLYIAQATRERTPAGIYGEVGTSLDEITPREELHLRAVARAHTETGLAIYTHCTLGTMALKQIDILLEEGADPERVVIGHQDLLPEVDRLERILATGVTIGFDTIGKEWFDYRVPGSEEESPASYVKWAYHRPDRARLEALTELCHRGYDDRIVLSTDMSGAEAWLNPATHGRYGYRFLPEVVLPRLQEAGLGDEVLRRMLVDNPLRILAVP